MLKKLLKNAKDKCKSLVMGILNATSDSFSGDGTQDIGELSDLGLRMIADGADILDIGGESSRPYSLEVDYKEEINRVIPVIKNLVHQISIPISLDTYHPETAQAGIDAGVEIINDITGLRNPDMMATIAKSNVSVIIMHMQGTPKTMQISPNYANIVEEIKEFFNEQRHRALENGIPEDRIIFDPGIGFGKTTQHNIQLLKSIHSFKSLGQPLLIGPSRKSFLGDILKLPVSDRLEGTLASVAISVINGADIVRVHDVRSVVRFLNVFNALVDDSRLDYIKSRYV